MCGINGIFNIAGVTREITHGLLQSMNEAVRHRGPDDDGIWIAKDRRIGFAHRRLSILDLSLAGHQPMHSHQGTVIVFNGEIYNFRDLRDDLNLKQFDSETDTEVLLCAYEKYGVDMLDKLNGMFAFAIWDQNRGRLFLVRDQIGIKPLYFTLRDGIFAFSSEIRALLTLPWVPAELDEEAFYHFLTFNKVYPPQTMFSGIHKFHPGHWMVVDGSGIKSYEKYWEVSYSNFDEMTFDEAAESLKQELRASVGRQMVSDVPVGAFLSGGVDSSAVTAFMSEFTDHPISTYSVGFAGAPDFTEIDWARKIAETFKTNHTEIIVSASDLKTFLPTLVDIFDEPLADATSIPIHFISEMARQNGTKVILTGDGSDELFVGYRNWLPYIRRQPLFDFFSQFPDPIKSVTARACRAVSPSSSLAELFDRARRNQQFFWGGASGFKESSKQLLLSQDFRNRIKPSDISSETYLTDYRTLFDSLPKNGKKIRYIDWLCFYGLKAIVPNFYLHRADRIGMASSIELRVPFLDHHLVNMALSFRGDYKIKGSTPKYLLKYALEDTLDKDILYRKKMGFCVPLKDWGGEVMLDYLDRNALSFCHATGLFNADFVQLCLDSVRSGSQKYAFAVWNLYFFINWHKKWLA